MCFNKISKNVASEKGASPGIIRTSEKSATIPLLFEQRDLSPAVHVAI